MELNNKIVVITGCSSGMGLAMAQRFSAAGALVIGGDIDTQSLEALSGQINEDGGKFIGQSCDVGQSNDAEALIARAVEEFGGLDVLVNNAGVMDLFQGLADVTDETLERVMRVNFYGPVYLSRAAIPHMIERGGGSIINVGSNASCGGASAGAIYTASKHALAGLTKNTAWRYAQQGIRCNTIAPGGVPTNIGKDLTPEIHGSEGFQRSAPYLGCMPRIVTVEDIASLALFLASDLSSNLNGALIPVDAGWCAA